MRGVNETAIRDHTTRADQQMIVCARYDVLRALADAPVEQIILWAIPNKTIPGEFSDQESRA